VKPGGRIDAVVICGGKYHDFDYARLELLALLAPAPPPEDDDELAPPPPVDPAVAVTPEAGLGSPASRS